LELKGAMMARAEAGGWKNMQVVEEKKGIDAR